MSRIPPEEEPPRAPAAATAEAEILLAAVRHALDVERPAAARWDASAGSNQPSPGAVAFQRTSLSAVDPHRLAALARRHECDALLYAALAGPGERLLPAAVRDGLALAYHRNGLRNRWLAERVGALLAELTAEGVPALPLKGVALAFAAYPAPELRPIGDLDLLVREDDFPAVRAVLGRHGWATALPALAARELPRYAQTVGQVRFGGAEPPIEVHFRLLNGGLPGAREDAWDDAGVLTAAARPGPVFATPAPERTVLHLALHAQQHAFSRLRLLVDLAAFVRSTAIDRGRLVELARHHRLATTTWLSWSWADTLLGCGPPPGELAPAAWRRWLAERAWRRRRVLALGAGRLPREAELPLTHLLGGASAGAKVAFLAAVAWPPRDWLPAGGRRRHVRRLLAGLAATAGGGVEAG